MTEHIAIIDRCRSREQVIESIYDSLGIVSPRGLNWDALEENLCNVGNLNLQIPSLKEGYLNLTIRGLDKIKSFVTEEDVLVFKSILLDATTIANRIDKIKLFVRIED